VGVRVRLLSDLFSITGVHPTQLPSDVWLSFDRQAADLQDLLLNEPWFLIEGLLWAGLGVAFTPALAVAHGRCPWSQGCCCSPPSACSAASAPSPCSTSDDASIAFTRSLCHLSEACNSSGSGEALRGSD